MHINVVKDRCIGVGNCAEVAPAFFDQDENDGIVVLLQEEAGAEHEEEVAQAAEVCPVQAILLGVASV